MEQEHFLSGYCRVQDHSRMVAVVTDSGELLEADCSFPDCPYATGCPVAEKIQELIK